MPRKGFLHSTPDCDEAVTGSAPDRHLARAAVPRAGRGSSDAGPHGVRKFGVYGGSGRAEIRLWRGAEGP